MVTISSFFLMLSKVVITDSGELPFGVSVKKEDAAFFIPPILYEN